MRVLLAMWCQIPLIAVVLFTLSTAGAAEPFQEIPGVRELSGRLVARPSATAGNAARERLAPFRVKHHDDVDEHILVVPAGLSDAELAQELLATGDYAYVEPDWRVYATVMPNDPQYDQQWHLPKIGAPAAWDITTGSPSVIIAVCDSGVDLDHPDLAGALVSGYNAVDGLPQSAGGLVDGLTNHGTQVAGSAAAIGDNGVGVSGVGWNLSIMPIRVSNLPNDSALISDINAGARWAAENGARVVNASFTLGTSESVQTTGEYLRSLDALYVWAAGNAGSSLGAADPPDVLLVAATDQADDPASFTNFGAAIDVAAPGVDIFTTNLGSYGDIDGTSFAAPITAGTIGLVWSINPKLSSQAVETIVSVTAADLGDSGEDDTYGHGRIDAAAAAQLAFDALTEPLAPIAFDDEKFSLNGDAILVDVLHNDVDLNGDDLAITGFDTTTPGGGTVELITGPGEPALLYTPAASFEGLETFEYTIEDPGGLSACATVAVGTAHAPDLDGPNEYTSPSTGNGQELLVGDVDGDGDLDLIADYSSALFPVNTYENVSGVFVAQPALELFNVGHALGVGDLNGDGCVDLALASQIEDSLSILLGNCDFTFAAPVITMFDSPVDIVAADNNDEPLDFDGEGDADLVMLQNGFQNNFTSILLGDGQGGVIVWDQVSTIDVAKVLAVGRVNGDEHLDVVMGGGGFGNVHVMPTDATGHFIDAEIVGYATGAPIADMDLADVNDDGHLDIITVSSGPFGQPGARVLLNDGTGGFGDAILVQSSGEFPRGVTAADFDLDGDGDVVTANMLSNDLSVQPGIAPGVFAPHAASLPVEAGPVDVIARDFDGDGDDDLAAQLLTSIQFNTRKVLVYDNLADPTPPEPADVNEDGVVDVLDLVAVILAFGQAGGPEDIDGNGVVDIVDLVAVILSWG